MTTQAAAATMIAGMRHVGGQGPDIERANAMYADGDFDGVRVLYEELETEMWRETRRDKMRGH